MKHKDCSLCDDSIKTTRWDPNLKCLFGFHLWYPGDEELNEYFCNRCGKYKREA